MPTPIRKTKSPSKPLRPAQRTNLSGPAARKPASSPLVTEYTRYFLAPATTPQGFQIFDMTDGASVSTTSHT